MVITRPAVPAGALLLSACALLVPLAATTAQLPELDRLLWLLALVPPFLLAYYRGWRGATVALAAGMAVLALAQAIENGLGGESPDPRLLSVAVCAYVGISLGVGCVSELLHRSKAQAEWLAYADPLTGLPNRRHARLALEQRFRQAESGRALALVFFDLDCFKAFNDAHGHRAGDAALGMFARVLRQSAPPGALVSRYGGEEFLMILSQDDEWATSSAVECVMRELERSRNGAAASLTVSAGIAVCSAGCRTPDDMLAAADAALYAAKAAGRNCYRYHSPDTLRIPA